VEKNGLKHPIGMMSIDTKDSPYVHSSKNGLTNVTLVTETAGKKQLDSGLTIIPGLL